MKCKYPDCFRPVNFEKDYGNCGHGVVQAANDLLYLGRKCRVVEQKQNGVLKYDYRKNEEGTSLHVAKGAGKVLLWCTVITPLVCMVIKAGYQCTHDFEHTPKVIKKKKKPKPTTQPKPQPTVPSNNSNSSKSTTPAKTPAKKPNPTPKVPSKHTPINPGLPQPNDHTAAGLLPYYKDDGGTVWFLLAQERHGNKFDKGYWADFGGGREKGHNTADVTAAHEAYEESTGLLGSAEKIQEAISKTVPSKNEGKTPQGKRVCYYSYFLEVKDSKRINTAALLAKQGEDDYKDDHHYQEKSQLAWIKSQDLFEAVNNRQNDTPAGFGTIQVKLYEQPDEKSRSQDGLLRGPFARSIAAMQLDINRQAVAQAA